jgi:diacylglycerol kinase (ATP)
MSKQALVVYNPTARSQDHEQAWLSRLVDVLSHRDNYVVTIYPTDAQTTSETIMALLKPGLDLVVAAGGDGTIRAVLAAMARSEYDIPVALMPLGTGNVLARNLGIVEERFFTDPLAHAFEPISDGVPVRIDMGLMNGHYFAGMAGAGPLSDAFMVPARGAKTTFKNLAYAKAMLETLAMRPVIFKITVVGRTFNVQASGIFVGNVEDLGFGKPCQLSTLTDGYLDLHILNPKNFSDYMAVGFRFAAGYDNFEAPHYVLRVKEVLIEVMPNRGLRSHFQRLVTKIKLFFEGKTAPAHPGRFIPAMIDGEPCGDTPMQISVVPQAVTILVPKSKIAQAEEQALSQSRPDLAAIVEDKAGVAAAQDCAVASEPTPVLNNTADTKPGVLAAAKSSDYLPGEVTGFISAAQIKAADDRANIKNQ